MAQTSIEWTDATWNPVTGCDKVSPGCFNCYAERQALRLRRTNVPGYQNGFAVTMHPDRLEQPARWRKPRRVFVNSMSDLYHRQAPPEFVAEIHRIIAATPQHTYQILTKRPHRTLALAEQLEWPNNLYLGVSVAALRYAFRINTLRQIPAAVRFISAEPLLAARPGLDLAGIHWLIAGGESGPAPATGSATCATNAKRPAPRIATNQFTRRRCTTPKRY